MNTLLYVKASPRGERSNSLKVANAFLDEYIRNKPDTELRVLDLYSYPLPELDNLTIQGKYNIMHGLEFSTEQQDAWNNVLDVIKIFQWADRFVFAVPMWNFSVPYKLKHLIDVITQPSLTFTVGPDGYKGLLTGRRALVAYASGGVYGPDSAAEAYNFQSPYMDLWLSFIGITDVYSVAAAGMLGPDKDAYLAKAVKRAQELAQDF